MTAIFSEIKNFQFGRKRPITLPLPCLMQATCPQVSETASRKRFRGVGRRWAPLCLIAILSLLQASSLHAQERQIKLAVIGISNPSTLRRSNIGNALVEILDSDISAAGKYTLLERAELNQLKRELNLGQSDLANAKSFAQKGGLAGADFLLMGKVSDYTYKETASRQTVFVPGSGYQVVIQYDHVGEVRVDLRLVDVQTGEDVRSVSGEGTDHNTGSVSFEPEWNAYISVEGQGTLSNLNTLLTNASNNAIQDAVQKLNDMYGDLVDLRARRSMNAELSEIGQGKILASLGQGQYVIGVQNTANLKVGDRFNVIGENLVRNSAGVVVYREKHNIGTLQVTDISESNRAMAQLVNSPAGQTGMAPQENDTIVYDENYGKSLRGMIGVGDGGATAEGSGGNVASAGDYLERGNRFLGEKEYSEALEQYKEGLQAQPNNAQLLAQRAIAEVSISDFNDAEDDAERAVAAGGSIALPVFHNHMFGYCEGNFVIAKGKVGFQPTTGNDGFTVGSKSQITIAQSIYTATNVPELIVHWRGEDGKNHRYYMVFTMFLTRVSRTVGLPYDADESAANKTAHLDGMVVDLINKSLP